MRQNACPIVLLVDGRKIGVCMDKLANYNNLYNNANLEQILDEYGDRLVVFINNIVKDPQVAEDIMMGCFVEVLSRHIQFCDVKSFKAYLYRCAKNKSINYIKMFNKLVSCDMDELTSEVDSIVAMDDMQAEVLEAIKKT